MNADGIARGRRRRDRPREIPAVDDGRDADPVERVEVPVAGRGRSHDGYRPRPRSTRPGRRRLGGSRRAAEIVVAHGAGRPVEAAHGAVAVAEQQDLGVPARVDVGERVAHGRRRAGVGGEVRGAGGAPGRHATARAAGLPCRGRRCVYARPRDHAGRGGSAAGGVPNSAERSTKCCVRTASLTRVMVPSSRSCQTIKPQISVSMSNSRNKSA